MESNNILSIICLMPVILIYGVAELKRGWKILKYGEPSLNLALQVRIWFLRLRLGNKVADEYRTNLLNDTKAMQVRGVYSIAEGLILLIGSALLVWSWLF